MPIDYSKGKIYKIITNCSNDIYIGSTTQELSDRMKGHRAGYKRWKEGKENKCSSYDLFDIHGIENCKIIWLEDYPCDSKRKLVAKEQEWINKLDCVNNNKAHSGFVSEKEYMKNYYEENKPKIQEYKKAWAQQNKQNDSERKKKWYEEHKEKISEKAKQHYQERKIALDEKFTCECGSIMRIGEIQRHRKSLRHQKFLLEKEN